MSMQSHEQYELRLCSKNKDYNALTDILFH